MANKFLRAVIILQVFCCGCSSEKNGNSSFRNLNMNDSPLRSKAEEIRVVKITHSTLDAQSSVLFGDDSYMVRGKVMTRFDSMYTTTEVLSKDASEYIIDFINKNMIDSVRGNLSRGQYFVIIKLYGVATKNLEFCLQPKTDNNFLGRLIDTINVSKYRNECRLLTSKLTEYDKINKSIKW